MVTKNVTKQEIEAFIQLHPLWEIKQGKLHRAFVFDDFIHAFEFMTQVALYAERIQHHPEWCNSYKRVVVDLITHETGGLTMRDFSLAKKMDELAA